MYNINIKKEKYCMYNEKIGKKIFNTPRGISNAIVIKNINNLTYNLLFFDTLLYFIKYSIPFSLRSKGTHRNESLEFEAYFLYNISREYILQSTER